MSCPACQVAPRGAVAHAQPAAEECARSGSNECVLVEGQPAPAGRAVQLMHGFGANGFQSGPVSAGEKNQSCSCCGVSTGSVATARMSRLVSVHIMSPSLLVL